MDKYAVIGNPVKHSLSPYIHQQFAKQTHQDISYTTIEAPIDGFNQAITEFIQSGGKGVNVTVPFKTNAFQLASEHSDLAKQAQAANTLAFREDGTIFADNTDGPGLVQDLTNNHQYSISQKEVLILGAGGACRTILGSILLCAPTRVVIANRTKQKAIDVAETFKSLGDVRGIGLDELKNETFDLIINTTSAGLTGELIPLPEELITKYTWCYDLVYGDKKSDFLLWAEKNHATKYLDGLGMLVEQAAACFYLWRGVYPVTTAIIAKMREAAMNEKLSAK